jgi:structure-specific recognition protein 1
MLFVVYQISIVLYHGKSSTINRDNCLKFLYSSGRHELRFYPGFFDLHGKSYDYKIPYNQITRGLLLPHKDNRQMYFVVNRIYFN